jgi:hypothetical protein
MVNSSSALGTFGFKGDTGNFANLSFSLDEVWVANHLMTGDEIQQLYLFNVIPEPASVALALIGAIASCAMALRRCR